jgi:hypothetical protein
MNERIRELATEVGISVEYLTNTKQWTLIEALAELIVRECAELAREWEDDYVVEDTAPFHSDVKIKKHFGVE